MASAPAIASPYCVPSSSRCSRVLCSETSQSSLLTNVINLTNVTNVTDFISIYKLITKLLTKCTLVIISLGTAARTQGLPPLEEFANYFPQLITPHKSRVFFVQILQIWSAAPRLVRQAIALQRVPGTLELVRTFKHLSIRAISPSSSLSLCLCRVRSSAAFVTFDCLIGAKLAQPSAARANRVPCMTYHP